MACGTTSMFVTTVLVVILVAFNNNNGGGVYSAAGVAESNKYIDNVLLVASKNNKVLDGVSVPDFDLHIKSDKIFNADIRGKFSKGRMNGFKNVKRSGDCTAPSVAGSVVTITCKLDVTGVSTKYEATVKGFNAIGTEKNIDYTNKIKSTVAQLVVSQDGSKPATVKTLFIDVINTDAEYQDLGFNEERKKKFKTEVDKKTSTAMFDVFYKTYAEALKDVLKTENLPK